MPKPTNNKPTKGQKTTHKSKTSETAKPEKGGRKKSFSENRIGGRKKNDNPSSVKLKYFKKEAERKPYTPKKKEPKQLDIDLKYFAIYKPYMTLCQFTKDRAEDVTLSDLELNIPVDCYPVGRLDKDSEGLLLLTNDNAIKTKLASPQFGNRKVYFVQVEGAITSDVLHKLKEGVTININGKSYDTLPAEVKKLKEPNLPPRNPPIRHRENIPTSWISMAITEGKNRQIRRMCASVGFPVLRLVRFSIGGVSLNNIQHKGLNVLTHFGG